MSQPRFPMLDPAEMTDRQKEVFEKIASGPRGGLRGPFVALIHNPDLADVVQQVGEYLRFNSTLSKDLIELAILIVARHWTCQFEWVVHERIARNNTDLPEAIIYALQAGDTPEEVSDEQRIVHDFVVRTLRIGSPASDVYAEAEQKFGKAGVLDLITICGYYSMLAMLLNTAEIPLPDGTKPPLRERV
jgi:4-carboxymuconolactone decarboxylase